MATIYGVVVPGEWEWLVYGVGGPLRCREVRHERSSSAHFRALPAGHFSAEAVCYADVVFHNQSWTTCRLIASRSGSHHLLVTGEAAFAGCGFCPSLSAARKHSLGNLPCPR